LSVGNQPTTTSRREIATIGTLRVRQVAANAQQRVGLWMSRNQCRRNPTLAQEQEHVHAPLYGPDECVLKEGLENHAAAMTLYFRYG
jgi:hypothetical protein